MPSNRLNEAETHSNNDPTSRRRSHKKTKQRKVKRSSTRTPTANKGSSNMSSASSFYFSTVEASVGLCGEDEEEEDEEEADALSRIEEASKANSSPEIQHHDKNAVAKNVMAVQKEEISEKVNRKTLSPRKPDISKKQRRSSRSKSKRGEEGSPPVILPTSVHSSATNSSHSTSLSSSRGSSHQQTQRTGSSSSSHRQRRLPADVEENKALQRHKKKDKKIRLKMAVLTAEVEQLETQVDDLLVDEVIPSSPKKMQLKKKHHQRRSSTSANNSQRDLSSSERSRTKASDTAGIADTIVAAALLNGTPKKKKKKKTSVPTTKETSRRAPVPPGDEDDEMVPSHRDSDGVDLLGPLPVVRATAPTTTSARRRSIPSRHNKDMVWEEGTSLEQHTKSFTKAVVAAAVVDATLNGRALSHHVKDKDAFSELSQDPVCSKHFYSMGQSFKAKPPPPPGQPQQADNNDGGNSRLTASNTGQTHRSQSTVQRESWRGRRLCGSSHRSSVDSNSRVGGDSSSGIPGEAASGAAKHVLEVSETDNHEMNYKIALLESVFDDVDHAIHVRNPKHLFAEAQASVDGGDDMVEPAKRRHSSKKQKKQRAASIIPPTRDVDEGMPGATKCDVVDVEKGLGIDEIDDEATNATRSMNSSRRRSTAASLESFVGLFKVNGEDGDKRCIWLMIVLVFFIIGITTAIVVGIVLTRDPTDEFSTTDDGSTMAPTSFRNDVLPWYTQLAFEYPASSQARAYYWLEHDVDRSSFSAAEALQKFVLATFFYSTRGDDWKKSDNWMAYKQVECTWYTGDFRSICDAAQRYHTLSLPSNSLQGTLPEELELLSALSIVQLQNNELVGGLPTRIWSSWNHLVFMNIYNNSLTGTLPAEISSLTNAHLLNTLSFRSNQFSGAIPTELGLLSLDFLSLSDNKFTSTLPSELGLLSNAKDIYLYGNSISGTIPSELGLLTKLTRLELQNNNLTGSVPVEVCGLISTGNLTTLAVDCAQVLCVCGCDCTAAENRLAHVTIFDEADGDK